MAYYYLSENSAKIPICITI